MDAYYLALCVDKSGAGVTTNVIVDSESDALESDRGDNIAGDDGEADGGEAGRVDERCLEEHLVVSDENFFGGGRLIGGGGGAGLVRQLISFGEGNARWVGVESIVEGFVSEVTGGLHDQKRMLDAVTEIVFEKTRKGRRKKAKPFI